jgi:hypothetical protein
MQPNHSSYVYDNRGADDLDRSTRLPLDLLILRCSKRQCLAMFEGFRHLNT